MSSVPYLDCTNSDSAHSGEDPDDKPQPVPPGHEKPPVRRAPDAPEVPPDRRDPPPVEDPRPTPPKRLLFGVVE